VKAGSSVRYSRLIPLLWLLSVVLWFSIFPAKSKPSPSDVLFEGVYLLAAMVSFFLVLRLGEWKLNLGWAALCEGLLFDFLDEFTLEAGYRLDVDAMQDVATTVGVLLLTFGFLAAAGRRESELEAVQLAAAEVERSRERLAAILESVSDGLVVSDQEGRVTQMNITAHELLGIPRAEAGGRSLVDLLEPQVEKQQALQDLMQDAVAHPRRAASGLDLHRHQEERPQVLSLGMSAIREQQEVVGIVCVLRDVTQRRQEELHLQQASRLESVGLLAGGVAHDFNNLLSAVMNWVSFSEVSEGDPQELQETFGEIRKACKRGKRLANQLLTFAKGGEPVVAPTDLLALIQEEVVFALRGSRVTPQFETARDLPHAEVDPVQIGQVVQNLVINAKQAMATGGRLEVDLECRRIDSQEGLPLDPGDYIQVSIRDNGGGISEEDLERIFDPYFSSKASGSGLGLATAYAIVRRHGGHIWAESELERGTCFRFLLPQTTQRATVSEIQPDKRLFHGRSVLVVDDDYSVQKPLVGTLKAIGFDVEACMTGADAVSLFRRRQQKGGTFDLILMDLSLRGEAGGAEAMGEILSLDASARGIVMSGYHHDPVMASFREQGFLGVMQKPFDYARMVAEMARVLGLESHQERP